MLMLSFFFCPLAVQVSSADNNVTNMLSETLINGRCCHMCRPGTYLTELCTDTQQTVCSPCPDGFFSQQYNIFNKCTQCQPCQGVHQEQIEMCSSTANAKCACSPGFLCTDEVCSECQKNNCGVGEKAMKTGLMQYECKPACPDHQYWDVKMNICRARTQCRMEGLVEQFPGNRTHNSVCRRHDNDALYVTLSMGCALLSLIVLVILSIACINVARKCKTERATDSMPVELASQREYHLSEEESRLQLQTDSNKGQLQEIVTTLS
ncbi:tumor necrosis factor receptor superfamily member 3-like [Dunckerocampus dactyliophorus]|uniref:tumor necrosis factor receptor superfamily member 3-like n=1 Tax=Dunckerocampus dactyliophorus TaxID=161453 RepID=UPI0024070B21|nr:tumor necrosis factor receptor superfamily member 3-like [Dunckerocampus dactyliophorus]